MVKQHVSTHPAFGVAAVREELTAKNAKTPVEGRR